MRFPQLCFEFFGLFQKRVNRRRIFMMLFLPVNTIKILRLVHGFSGSIWLGLFKVGLVFLRVDDVGKLGEAVFGLRL